MEVGGVNRPQQFVEHLTFLENNLTHWTNWIYTRSPFTHKQTEKGSEVFHLIYQLNHSYLGQCHLCVNHYLLSKMLDTHCVLLHEQTVFIRIKS